MSSMGGEIGDSRVGGMIPHLVANISHLPGLGRNLLIQLEF